MSDDDILDYMMKTPKAWLSPREVAHGLGDRADVESTTASCQALMRAGKLEKKIGEAVEWSFCVPVYYRPTSGEAE